MFSRKRSDRNGITRSYTNYSHLKQTSKKKIGNVKDDARQKPHRQSLGAAQPAQPRPRRCRGCTGRLQIIMYKVRSCDSGIRTINSFTIHLQTTHSPSNATQTGTPSPFYHSYSHSISQAA